MINNPDGLLNIYMLNVGQADTTVMISPKGRVIVIDAVSPTKLVQLLTDIGINGTIEHLIITHPHDDHFRGANRLTQVYQIEEATVPPFWHDFGVGPPTYRALVARLGNQGTNINFLSGYYRWYPDGALILTPDGKDATLDPNSPSLELLGPTNALIHLLEDASVFNANHLSIMCRITWGNFRMICAGDAQMENWAYFDQERLMDSKCQILRAAHHGSSNGTQWERLERLGPSLVIVSSDPMNGHKLPDLGSSAVFLKYDHEPGKCAVVTSDSGTIHVKVDNSNNRTQERYGDDLTTIVNLGAPIPLDETLNPTNWAALLNDRVIHL